jgi:hypothetical protein
MMSTFALAGPPQIIRRVVANRVPGAAALPAGDALADALLDILLGGIEKRKEIDGRGGR